MTPDEFFSGREESRRIFEEVCEAVSTIGHADIRVTKSQVAFRHRVGFAFVWLPDMYLGKGGVPLVLTVALRRRDESPRWKQIVEPARGRFTHHLELRAPSDVDDEVRGWLREAWEAAGEEQAVTGGRGLKCREMAAGEEQAVLALVMRGFDEAVRPDFSEAGAEEFSKAARSFILERPPGHRILVAEDRGELVGMIDLRDCSHVALFFVESAHRGRGVGSALLEAAIGRCDESDAVTVNAAPSAVSAYLRLGFEAVAAEAEQNGIRYVRMRKGLSGTAEGRRS